jgi:hypothetical protein
MQMMQCLDFLSSEGADGWAALESQCFTAFSFHTHTRFQLVEGALGCPQLGRFKNLKALLTQSLSERFKAEASVQ